MAEGLLNVLRLVPGASGDGDVTSARERHSFTTHEHSLETRQKSVQESFQACGIDRRHDYIRQKLPRSNVNVR